MSLRSCISFLFNSLDFFAMRPSDRITFEQTQKYSTTLGKSVSWVLIGLIVALFMNFGGDMIYHRNPRSSFSQIVTPDPAKINLKNSGFFMAFGLEDMRNFSNKYIDETVYQAKLYQRIKIGTNITMEEIPVERCSVDHVPESDDLKEYFRLNQINELYCLGKDSSFDLQSTWDGPVYRNILLNIVPCINSSNSSKKEACKSSEEIKEYLDHGNYAIYFTNLAVDPNNYEKPLTSYGKVIYTPIDSSSSTYIEMLFGHMEFTSDEGILFSDENSRKSASFISHRQVSTSNPNQIVQVDIKLDKIKNIYSRNYDKIQTVLAYMGGIINFCMIASKLLILPLIKLRFKLSLANALFQFKKYQKLKEITSCKNIFKSKMKINFNSKRINNISKLSEIVNNKFIKNQFEDNQIIRSFEQKKNEKMDISYISYFSSCLRDNITEIHYKMIEKGLNRIDQMLDISYLMKKLTEIDILKVLLLNKTQRDLFEFIPKPEISLEKTEKSCKNKLFKEISLSYGRSISEKAKLASQAYLEIIKKREKSELDEKIIQLFLN